MRPRLTIGSRGIPHHGAHSGYGLLVGALRERLPVRLIDGSRGSRLPRGLARRAAARTGMRWYDESALAVEEGVARALCRGETCHLLYGEDTLHYCGLARRLAARGRLVATFHQPPELFDVLMAGSPALKGLDAAIAPSRELRDHLAACLGVERVFFVPHGVDTGFFTPPAEPARDPLSCLVVGWWQRDADVLGAVVRRVRSHLPEVRFEAVVPPWAEHEARAATGVEPLVGISDAALLRRYQQAAAVVLPLKSATANNALLEAASCATPVVVTDVGGVRDHLDQTCAELAPPSDSEAMADLLLALLDSPSRQEQLGRMARARALELDWGRVAEQHLRIYEPAPALQDSA